MSLFDSASVVITPNGIKEDKLYAIKPTDGSGDLVVTRATTATRVNSAGLVELVPYNVLTYSEQFDNAIWAISGTITKTANSVTAPNGTLTADTILSANSSSYISQSYTGTNGVGYTNSFFIKNNNSTQSALIIRNTVSAISASINWSGSVLTSITNTLGVTTFEDYGNGWYRIISTYTALEDAQKARIYPTASTNQSVYLWGAQLVTGTSAKEYFPTTDRLDVPRLDYTNSSCPSILVEPQRTNLALRSEEFNDATWTTNGLNVTVSSNSTTAPDGNSTADSILTTTTNGLHYVQQRTGSAIAGTTYTMSVYVKKLGYDYCQIFTSNTGTGIGIFRFSTKTLTISGANVVANSGKVTEMSNGWFRIEMSILAPASAGWRWWIVCLNDSAQDSFTGDITKGLYVWGFQFEVGSNATSYVPTIASSVTRNTDVISKTAISSLIGQTDGTLFFEVKGFSDGNPDFQFITLNDGTTNNQIGFSYNAGGIIQGYFRINSVTNTINSSISKTLNSKIILKYSSNNYKLFINGVLIGSGTSASGFSSPLTTFKASQGNNSGNYNGNIKTIAIYKTALTDTECINLTTL